MTVDISTRREDIEQQLAELRRTQAEQFLDGGKHTARQGDITRLQNELAMLNQAEGVQSERARAEAERERQQRLQNIRVKISNNEKVRLEAVEQAEAATRALLAALERARDAAKSIEKMAPHVTGDRIRGGLSYAEFERRLSNRIVAVLVQFNPVGKRIGNLQFQYTGLVKPEDDWRASEERATDGEHRQIFDGRRNPHHRQPAVQQDEPQDDVKLIEHQPQEGIKLNGNSNGKFRR